MDILTSASGTASGTTGMQKHAEDSGSDGVELKWVDPDTHA